MIAAGMIPLVNLLSTAVFAPEKPQNSMVIKKQISPYRDRFSEGLLLLFAIILAKMQRMRDNISEQPQIMKERVSSGIFLKEYRGIGILRVFDICICRKKIKDATKGIFYNNKKAAHERRNVLFTKILHCNVKSFSNSTQME